LCGGILVTMKPERFEELSPEEVARIQEQNDRDQRDAVTLRNIDPPSREELEKTVADAD
jgi:hypothetical protein